MSMRSTTAGRWRGYIFIHAAAIIQIFISSRRSRWSSNVGAAIWKAYRSSNGPHMIKLNMTWLHIKIHTIFRIYLLFYLELLETRVWSTYVLSRDFFWSEVFESSFERWLKIGSEVIAGLKKLEVFGSSFGSSLGRSIQFLIYGI